MFPCTFSVSVIKVLPVDTVKLTIYWRISKTRSAWTIAKIFFIALRGDTVYLTYGKKYWGLKSDQKKKKKR